jgi:hypothetical protein
MENIVACPRIDIKIGSYCWMSPGQRLNAVLSGSKTEKNRSSAYLLVVLFLVR